MTHPISEAMFNRLLDEYQGSPEIECETPGCFNIYDPDKVDNGICPSCNGMLPDDGGFLENHFNNKRGKNENN